MRLILTMIAVTLLAGCASTKPQPPANVAPHYEDAPAAALAFTPSIAIEQPPLMLAREPREAAAFVGFEDLMATFFYICNDDVQFHDGWMVRRALSEKVGVSYR
jgi:hypothetical protein